MILLLTLLIFVPIIAYKIARRKMPQHVFSITGAAFGSVVAPLSIGLYSWFHFSVVGLIPGVLGLILSMIHEPPGFHMAIYFELIPKGDAVSGIAQNIKIEAINAVVWSVVYGLIGHMLDSYLQKKKRKASSLG